MQRAGAARRGDRVLGADVLGELALEPGDVAAPAPVPAVPGGVGGVGRPRAARSTGRRSGSARRTGAAGAHSMPRNQRSARAVAGRDVADGVAVDLAAQRHAGAVAEAEPRGRSRSRARCRRTRAGGCAPGGSSPRPRPAGPASAAPIRPGCAARSPRTTLSTSSERSALVRADAKPRWPTVWPKRSWTRKRIRSGTSRRPRRSHVAVPSA